MAFRTQHPLRPRRNLWQADDRPALVQDTQRPLVTLTSQAIGPIMNVELKTMQQARRQGDAS